ncbi:MAG TPA: hypothetical protein PK883_08600, partial [Anaerolineaceae bacterium]|nr:hypothetical protein [Anaerolineaceae bacterium]
ESRAGSPCHLPGRHRLSLENTASQPRDAPVTVWACLRRSLTASQTASALRVPSGTIKSRLSKAKQMLKEMIQDEIEL